MLIFRHQHIRMPQWFSSVIFNCLTLPSCELLESQNRGGGTLGLFRFKPPGRLPSWTEDLDCQKYDGNYSEIEDAALNCARACAILALIFGAVILLFGFFKQCLCKIPCTKIIMNISGFGVQISMALVYVAWANKLCDNGGCFWGEGLIFNLLAQICYAVSSCFVRAV
jgi:hypothetical protein